MSAELSSTKSIDRYKLSNRSKNSNAAIAKSRFVALASFFFGLALMELVLANRKYGLFTGGFGQSQAVDSLAERLLFTLGYSSSLLMFVLGSWWVFQKLSGARQSWPPLFNLFVIAGGGYAVLLAMQYQLHSYFSDTISFTLMANLGGGSLLDALLFAANEIMFGAGAAIAGAIMIWLLYRILLKKFPPQKSKENTGHWGYALIGSSICVLCLSFVMPSWSSDSFNGLNRTLVWKGAINTANFLTDFDRDGYGLVARMPDRFPFDAARHPLALDIPGNGIDEDGFGGDLELIPTRVTEPLTVIDESHRPHLIIVVLESVRYDVLGKRIAGVTVAPNLEAIAAQGSAIAPSFSHIGFTTESLKSIFSGSLNPQKSNPSLFRELKQSGYDISVFSGQPEDFGDISETVGMQQNADIFVDGTKLKHLRAFKNGAQGSTLIDEGYIMNAYKENYKDPAKWGKPQFIYMNFQSPHFPYYHADIPLTLTDQALPRSEINAENARELRATYWNAVAYADQRLGELITDLKAKGAWDNSVVVVTGDHGEELFEDGFLGHGHMVSKRQYGTFFVTNRPGIKTDHPIGLKDYRSIILSLMQQNEPKLNTDPVLMMVGSLEKPIQIGIAEIGDKITTLRLDTGEACLSERKLCRAVGEFDGEAGDRIDRLIKTWGTKRWQAHLATK